jgi:ABC-type transport system involved in multi-copper enzyme maturation permease subunit
MPSRWGLGPVFVCESKLNARKWQVYAGRSFFVLVLLMGMVIVWLGKDDLALATGRVTTFQQMAKVGEGFFYAITGIQIALILLAAPAAAAGSICSDRSRGTLLHMLVTDLSDGEIVLGKFAARLVPVFGLIACGVPVTALAALLGGIEFGALAGAFAVSMALAVLGCALAMTISVWAAKTHEVLMAVYVLEGLWLLALPIYYRIIGPGTPTAPPAWFQKANPYVLVFAPYNKPGWTVASDYAVFVGVVLTLAAALLGLSIMRLRRVVIAQAGRPEEARRSLPDLRPILPTLAGPSLDSNPVLWREWHRNRPSKLARWLWLIILLIVWSLAAWGTYRVVAGGALNDGLGSLQFAFMLNLLFGFLMLSATAPTVLAEERVRGSLDVLLTTPLSTTSIVVAKWWGIYRGVLILTLLPLGVGALFAFAPPAAPICPPGAKFPKPPVPLAAWERTLSVTLCALDCLASGAVLVSIGFILATWVRRLGRAVALSVILYFLLGIGLPVLADMLFPIFIRSQWTSRGAAWVDQHRWIMDCAASFSPCAGPIRPVRALDQYAFEPRGWVWRGIGLMILIKAAIAGFLLWIAIKTFDRCLGRVPETSTRARSRKMFARDALAPSTA